MTLLNIRGSASLSTDVCGSLVLGLCGLLDPDPLLSHFLHFTFPCLNLNQKRINQVKENCISLLYYSLADLVTKIQHRSLKQQRENRTLGFTKCITGNEIQIRNLFDESTTS